MPRSDQWQCRRSNAHSSTLPFSTCIAMQGSVGAAVPGHVSPNPASPTPTTRCNLQARQQGKRMRRRLHPARLASHDPEGRSVVCARAAPTRRVSQWAAAPAPDQTKDKKSQHPSSHAITSTCCQAAKPPKHSTRCKSTRHRPDNASSSRDAPCTPSLTDDDDCDRLDAPIPPRPPTAAVHRVVENPIRAWHEEVALIANPFPDNWDDELLRLDFVDAAMQLSLEPPFKTPSLAAVVLVGNAHQPEVVDPNPTATATARLATDSRP
ncbi:hypothetical protein QBC39DRAFT_386765 [Podospora conica]|nr:hypothetical protein QBC39DRAFT_386765 [Schizothecium conicum]